MHWLCESAFIAAFRTSEAYAVQNTGVYCGTVGCGGCDIATLRLWDPCCCSFGCMQHGLLVDLGKTQNIDLFRANQSKAKHCNPRSPLAVCPSCGSWAHFFDSSLSLSTYTRATFNAGSSHAGTTITVSSNEMLNKKTQIYLPRR
ncbi:hypothetical protein BCV70DRAFT_53232 [Testicularia cyperi]|uniref:Uncharacterized protein n=1 Tax=Testicularia cyperi TaxID=1882483 RepID=A0A317XU76_9BASI|nr:hypothetical protein BCV70DRAFT_53232 [Testicularia cyperi]